MRTLRAALVGLVVVLLAAVPARADSVPIEDLDPSRPLLPGMIERYETDLALVRRRHDAPFSAAGAARREAFHAGWLDALEAMDFDALGAEDRIDWLLFRNELRYAIRSIEHERAKQAEIADLVPFAEEIVALHEARRRFESVDAPDAAATLDALVDAVEEARTHWKEQPGVGADEPALAPALAHRAAGAVERLRSSLRSWYRFHAGYDPLFTWWVEAPYEDLEPALQQYASFLRSRFIGGDDDTIIGDPVGRDELMDMLAREMIAYEPEALLAIAEREYAWCLAEMLRASNELGFGDDWKAALDHVKSLHVEPGAQPELIRDLAYEAIEFLEARDLVTIPLLCRDSWRMEMMSPQRQKASPYFLGGETILVAFPTNTMEHGDKLMSLRGNNRHFARATVQHELIPGHHLQGFMTQRYRTHRSIFNTPFWIEGWALYWEMRLWDLDFPQSPEDRVGMLFWRMHRCARIVFSLKFHLGEMTALEAIDYLVENVGHERNNAEAEVRRSVRGDYGPLYQAAYMLGGLQVRALHEELVASGRMAERAFHDAILRQNSIPIEMVRAALRGDRLPRDFEASWRFADE